MYCHYHSVKEKVENIKSLGLSNFLFFDCIIMHNYSISISLYSALWRDLHLKHLIKTIYYTATLLCFVLFCFVCLSQSAVIREYSNFTNISVH